MDDLVDVVLTRCRILYKGDAVTDAAAVQSYLRFFRSASGLAGGDGFILQVGAPCFDAAALALFVLRCICMGTMTQREIVGSLRDGDMVIYNNARKIWRGVVEIDGRLHMKLEEEPTRNVASSVLCPMLRGNEHLVRPYYGGATKANGIGVVKGMDVRERFLSRLFRVPEQDAPVETDASFVVLGDKEYVEDLYKNVSLDCGISVSLQDLAPAVYHTRKGSVAQIGSNPLNAAPVLHAAPSVSVARSAVMRLARDGAVGFLSFGDKFMDGGSSEMRDLLAYGKLDFRYVSGSMGVSDRFVSDACGSRRLFACTDGFLQNQVMKKLLPAGNESLLVLANRAHLVLSSSFDRVAVPGGMGWGEYVAFRDALLEIRQSGWDDDDARSFVRTACGLAKLFRTMPFSVSDMDSAVKAGRCGPLVEPVEDRLMRLESVMRRNSCMRSACGIAFDCLLSAWDAMFVESPKMDALAAFVSGSDVPVGVVVQKAWHADVLASACPSLASDRARCGTLRGLLKTGYFRRLACTYDPFGEGMPYGDVPFGREVTAFLYDGEKRFADRTDARREAIRDWIEKKACGCAVPERPRIPHDDRLSEEDVAGFDDLDGYAAGVSSAWVPSFLSGAPGGNQDRGCVTVEYAGAFASGERIWFSRYYSAVVYDEDSGSVSEKAPEDLSAGDVVIFMRRDGEAGNIVDSIFAKLLERGMFEDGADVDYGRAVRWKESLRRRIDEDGMSCTDLARIMKEAGSSVHEATVRKWVAPESRVVGPQRRSDMLYIGMAARDDEIVSDPDGFYDACVHTRSLRKDVLKRVGKAVLRSLSGGERPSDAGFDVVWDDVDRLSYALELEAVVKLDKPVDVRPGMANVPVSVPD